MSDSTSRDLIERYYRAVSSGDFDALLEIFADDVVVEWPQSGERFQGKEQCLRIWQSYPGGRPQIGGVERVRAEGSLATGEAKVTYPDGKTYLVALVLEIRDGKIQHEVDYFAEPFPVPEWRAGWANVG